MFTYHGGENMCARRSSGERDGMGRMKSLQKHNEEVEGSRRLAVEDVARVVWARASWSAAGHRRGFGM